MDRFEARSKLKSVLGDVLTRLEFSEDILDREGWSGVTARDNPMEFEPHTFKLECLEGIHCVIRKLPNDTVEIVVVYEPRLNNNCAFATRGRVAEEFQRSGASVGFCGMFGLDLRMKFSVKAK